MLNEQKTFGKAGGREKSGEKGRGNVISSEPHGRGLRLRYYLKAERAGSTGTRKGWSELAAADRVCLHPWGSTHLAERSHHARAVLQQGNSDQKKSSDKEMRGGGGREKTRSRMMLNRGTLKIAQPGSRIASFCGRSYYKGGEGRKKNKITVEWGVSLRLGGRDKTEGEGAYTIRGGDINTGEKKSRE